MQTCNTLLVVDDVQINRMILRAMFKDEYEILEAENGEQGMALLRKNRSRIATVLLDLLMPVKDGYEVLQEMEEDAELSGIPVVVITADSSAESEIRIFDLGASDIITKPFEAHAVKRRVKNAVELYRHKLHLEELVEEQAVRIRESNIALIDGLSSVIEHRSLESGQHIRRIRGFTKILLMEVAGEHPEYGLDERQIQIIADASSLHDIGKIAIPDAILNKPGKLTAEEFEIMKTHTVRGCEILASLDRMQEPEYLRYAYHICRYHHERWDGKGYPDGLRENNIPICAQVVSVADCFDALTTDRVYKNAIPQSEAYNMILHGACGAFSPALMECFKNVQADFSALSRKYADDTQQHGKTELHTAIEFPPNHEESPAALGQFKMAALLRYLDATVLEVDWDAGTYHLLYQADDNFSAFQQKETVWDAGEDFVDRYVHPEDRFTARKQLEQGRRQLETEGAMSIPCRYRILDRATGRYCWYESTILRLGATELRHCCALIVWRKDTAAEAPAEEPVEWQAQDRQVIESAVAAVRRRSDRKLTLMRVSRGFLHLVGYNKEELENQFQNHMAELIAPADRDRVVAQISRQMNTKRETQTEYRINCRDGRSIWVQEKGRLKKDEDGNEYFQCILTDISSMKRVQEELRQTLERYKIAVQEEGEIVFEWDIATDRIWVSGNWEMKFGYQPIGYLQKVLTARESHLYPMDAKNIRRAMESVEGGALREEAEFRISTADGQYRWQRARATVLLGGDGRPRRAIGVIADMEEEKRAIQGLEDQAQRDSLTRLYHKAAAQKKIEWYLDQMQESDVSVMMILDVDDFKAVNDRYGHLFGDAVLVELSGIIGKLFRDADVVARIGGDEFLVFMPFVPAESVAVSRAQELLDACTNMMQRADLSGYRLSCSVGVALAPSHGTTYTELFRRCDQALYQAKAAGKNTYALYDVKRPKGKPADKGRINSRTEIDSQTDIQNDLSRIVAEAFRQYYESLDFESAVMDTLERVGKLFHVSRAYIFEESADGLTCSNTFEWCNKDILPYKDKLQQIRYTDLGPDYRKNFNEQGIFFCKNIDTLAPEQKKIVKQQNILSILQCAIMDGEKFVGFVGFDDCEIHRLWTQAQIDAIRFISKILFLFLKKARKTRQLKGLRPGEGPGAGGGA